MQTEELGQSFLGCTTVDFIVVLKMTPHSLKNIIQVKLFIIMDLIKMVKLANMLSLCVESF